MEPLPNNSFPRKDIFGSKKLLIVPLLKDIERKGGVKTNKIQKISFLAAATGLVLFAVACVSASPSTASTPLYTVRMEQASSEMSFLPTAVNEFTYTTEKGYTLDCSAAKYCTDAELLITTPADTCYGYTCDFTCLGYTHSGSTCLYTCDGFTHFGDTCYISCIWFTCDYGITCTETCWPTCPVSCYGTCSGYTCDATSCQPTCYTCNQPTCPDTCWETCDDPTCYDTCEQTCRYTCEKPCVP